MYINAKGVELATTSTGSVKSVSGGAGALRTGSSVGDLFHSQAGDTLSGGLGNDVYYLWDGASKVVERPSEGVETVYVKYWGVYQLAANVENAILSSDGANGVTGNALNNLLVAGTVHAAIDGGAGDDVLVGGAGSDVFKITAGNGSDAIYNFRPGWDAVQLKGYGLTSFDQIKAASTQVGSDVNVRLSSTESLVLRDVQLSALHAADFGLSTKIATLASLGDTVYGADRAVNNNGWYVFTNAWGRGAMVEGRDYTLDGSFNKSQMAKGADFTWSFPTSTELYQTIKAYPEVIFGISPMNPVRSNPTDTAMVLPVKVSDIVSLTSTHDLSYTGNLGGFNVSYDIWLTNKAYGDKSTLTNEVMVWVHKGDFAAFGTLVGTYTAPDGATAQIFHKGTYTAVVFDTDQAVAVIDIKGILGTLGTLGIVAPTEYVGSIELGAEVVGGVGQLTINDINLRVASMTAGGGTVVKSVTGAGTTVVNNPPVVGDMAPVTTLHHNAFGAVVGSDKVIYFADGHVVTQHYSADGALIGAEKSVGYLGQSTVQYFDSAWNPTGIDKVTDNFNGTTSIQHYDPDMVLTGSELVVAAAGGTTSFHYDANTILQSIDVSNVEATGVTRTLTYNSTYQLVEKASYSGTVNGDVLAGDGGPTHLHGGLGSDSLHGGAGVDYFHFDTAIGQGDVDAISSFSVGQDKIVLDHAVFSGLGLGALDPADFVTGAAAADDRDRVIFDNTTGSLWYDDDGVGAHVPVLLARITADGALSAGDILVV